MWYKITDLTFSYITSYAILFAVSEKEALKKYASENLVKKDRIKAEELDTSIVYEFTS